MLCWWLVLSTGQCPQTVVPVDTGTQYRWFIDILDPSESAHLIGLDFDWVCDRQTQRRRECLARRRVGLLTPALCFMFLMAEEEELAKVQHLKQVPQPKSLLSLDASTSSKLLDVFLLAKGFKPKLSHLHKGVQMGSNSPEQLHNSLVLHYYLIIASLLLHYFCNSTALLQHYYCITTDFYYINTALLPLCSMKVYNYQLLPITSNYYCPYSIVFI